MPIAVSRPVAPAVQIGMFCACSWLCSRSSSAEHCSAGGNRFEEIPRMIDLYRAGIFNLDELITTRYTIDEINRGCQDLPDGKNICNVVIHDH